MSHPTHAIRTDHEVNHLRSLIERLQPRKFKCRGQCELLGSPTLPLTSHRHCGFSPCDHAAGAPGRASVCHDFPRHRTE